MAIIANKCNTPQGTYINDVSDPMASKIKLRFVSRNVGSMTGKSLELEKFLVRRGIDILCTQETKWANTGNRSRFFGLKSKGF